MLVITRSSVCPPEFAAAALLSDVAQDKIFGASAKEARERESAFCHWRFLRANGELLII